jgi:Family of unknown function (DUF6012)
MRPFLYHIRPRFFVPHLALRPAKLLELRIDELGVHLKGKDIRTGNPHRAKAWFVGHRRIGRKPVDGILFAFSDWPPSFEVSARWVLAAEYVVKVKTIYMLLDKDHSAASDDYTLWNAASQETCTFKDRWPVWARDDEGKPIEDVLPKPMPERDVVDACGRSFGDTAAFSLPTIEPERILGVAYPSERIARPSLDMAIRL